MEISKTIISQFGHHGEVQFYKAKNIAKGFEKSDKQVLAKGSKGGNHSVVGDYELYTSKEYDGKFYVKVNSPSTVIHHQGDLHKFDGIPNNFAPKNHDNGELPEGIYFVTKQHKLDLVNRILVENRD